MRRTTLLAFASTLLACLGGILATPAPTQAGQFNYKPPGQLEAPSQGRNDAKIYAPGMRFPIEQAPAYANSQVYGHGGYKGPGGSQCHPDNYSYPWWDNYCEPRRWNMPLCPGGKGHQGQDIRPQKCKDSTYWTVAAEDGTITHIGTYSVYLKTSSGRTHRYLHLNHNRLAVREGQQVRKGDRIGLVSNNMGGTPTTIHLHYDFKQYVQGVGTVFVPPYMSLVDSYKRLLGQGGIGDRYKAEMTTRVAGLKDRWDTGSSKDVPDTFRNQTFKAIVTLKNASREVWQNVQIGYQFDADHLTPLDYRIESDHPHYDQKTWSKNDADSHPKNPSKSKMGASGRLHLYAFSPGETKRVLVTLKAGAYSIDGNDRPTARFWLRHIDGIYGEQTGFFKDPTDGNKFGKNIRDDAEVDVLSRDHWHFAGVSEADLEGWTNKNKTDSPQVMRNKEDDLLAQHITGPDAQLTSPEWTRIDADRWDELVLRVRSHDGPHTIAVYWTADGQSFSEERVVRIESPGNSSMVGHRIPVGRHPKWRGTIDRLRVDLLDGRAPADDARGWYGLADVFLQHSGRKETNTERFEYLELPVSELLDDRTNEDPAPDVGMADTGSPPDGHPDAALNPPPTRPSGPDTGPSGGSSGGAGQTGGNNAISTSSCSTTGGGAPLSVVWLLAGALACLRRRD